MIRVACTGVFGLTSSRVPPHARFSREHTRMLVHRWRPLDEDAPRLVRYTRALEALAHHPKAFGIVGGEEEGENLHLYVVHAETPSVHVVAEVLWAPETDALERVHAARALHRWHDATFRLVTLVTSRGVT
tara:strand:- start:909 stop:1301 length:393 start_codon:yes stop_codon:yes gene_type:complete